MIGMDTPTTDPSELRARLVQAWRHLEDQSMAMGLAMVAAGSEPDDLMPLFNAMNNAIEALRGMRDAVDASADEINRLLIGGLSEIIADAVAEGAKR